MEKLKIFLLKRKMATSRVKSYRVTYRKITIYVIILNRLNRHTRSRQRNISSSRRLQVVEI